MRMSTKEFVVNEIISLKLEEGKTNIYLKGELFRQCKYLILSIPIERIEDFKDIKSIEDTVEKLKSTERDERVDLKYDISPEEEFFGHCSNIQVWAENGYDSRILHYSLSFSLLQGLAEYDSDAKSILKEEVAKRLESGAESVINYIRESNLDKLLSYEVLVDILVHPEDAEILKEVESKMGTRFFYSELIDSGFFLNNYEYNPVNIFDLKNKRINYLGFKGRYIRKIPDAVCKFKYLESIGFYDFEKITYFPESLRCLEIFDGKTFKFVKKQTIEKRKKIS